MNNHSIRGLILLACLVGSVAALLLLVRIVVAVFSEKVSDQISRHPVQHLIWAGLAFIGVLFWMGALDPGMWPPPSVERREQRAKVAAQIEAAGGWATLQKDCCNLVERNIQTGFHWSRGDRTNDLPRSIAALNAWQVQYFPPSMGLPNQPEISVLQIKVFGIHSTGGHSTPYYGLEVVCSTNAAAYQPAPGQGVSGNHHYFYREITNGVFEIY